MEVQLSLSIETFALKNCPYFISAFPSYIVFGKTTLDVKYEENKYFSLHFFEAYKWLQAIFFIGSFIASDLDDSNGVIVTTTESEIYYWTGLVMQNQDENEKHIKFGIEKNSEILFEMLFTVVEFNNFLYLFKRCLLSCLCLKDMHEQFILHIVETQSFNEIIAAKKSLRKTKIIFDDFFKDSLFEKPSKISSFSQIISYYNDIILIIKQLENLSFEEEDKSALILANLK